MRDFFTKIICMYYLNHWLDSFETCTDVPRVEFILSRTKASLQNGNFSIK